MVRVGLELGSDGHCHVNLGGGCQCRIGILSEVVLCQDGPVPIGGLRVQPGHSSEFHHGVGYTAHSSFSSPTTRELMLSQIVEEWVSNVLGSSFLGEEFPPFPCGGKVCGIVEGLCPLFWA